MAHFAPKPALCRGRQYWHPRHLQSSMVWDTEQALAWEPVLEQGPEQALPWEPAQAQERELVQERELAHLMGQHGTHLHVLAEVEVEWPALPSRGAKASPGLSCPTEAGIHCMNA